MTDSSFIVEASDAGRQGADFAALPALAHRLGVSFEDVTPPRHLTIPGTGGVRLHALDWGGDGAPALFLHGGRLTAQTWDYVCLGLRKQVRAVALDLRGHGDSDRSEDYSFDSHVADIGAVLDVLAWPKAHLVGMSYGGFIAAHFAAAAPRRVSSLVTIDVGPGVVFEGTARIFPADPPPGRPRGDDRGRYANQPFEGPRAYCLSRGGDDAPGPIGRLEMGSR